MIAGAVAMAAILLWVVRAAFTPDESAAPSGPFADNQASSEEFAADFRPLTVQAYATVRESVSADEGEEAAAAVQETIGRIQESWVYGDIDRHLSYYADRVDFRGNDGTTRERIGELRRESIEQYPEREISIDNLAIEFVAPGRARALVDRRWRFTGDEVWEGGARDEMVLVREDDGWRVVSEVELENFPPI